MAPVRGAGAVFVSASGATRLGRSCHADSKTTPARLASAAAAPITFIATTASGQTGTVQSWPAPEAGDYRSTALGASGGNGGGAQDDGLGGGGSFVNSLFGGCIPSSVSGPERSISTMGHAAPTAFGLCRLRMRANTSASVSATGR